MRVAAAAVTAALTCTLVGCAPDPAPTRPSPTTATAGPTLARSPIPSDWRDVPGPGGLIYSVPADWGRLEDAGGGAREADRAPDDGQDWGTGYVTVANTVAGYGYCPASGTSFRVLTGMTDTRPGTAEEQARSAARSLTDALSHTFTQNGADVPAAEPRLIGVSGAPAWYVSLRGRPREPRHRCTPPVIRIDVVAVATRAADGSEATQLFLVMADEEEPGVQPTEVVDRVVASLRYEDSI